MIARAPVLALSLLCASAVALGGCVGPLVEFDCAPGREACDGRCVPVGTCRAVPTCDSGECVDAGRSDAADAGPAFDPRDAGPIPGVDDGGTPVLPPTQPLPHGANPLPPGSWPELPPGSLPPSCEPPLVACGNGCVDLASDPDHCGACGTACPTGICRDGACEASYPGHFVLLGHDFRVVRDAPARLLANAVLLAPGTELSIATFVGTARPGAVSGAWRAISARAAATGRVVSRIDVDESSVLDALGTVDVLLVPSQASTSPAHVAELGVGWAAELARFLGRGGVVVVLDGGGDETWRLVDAAGLLDVRDGRDITGEVLSVGAPSDAIATGVPLRYRAERSSVCFDTAEPGGVVLGSCGPVALHRTIAAP